MPHKTVAIYSGGLDSTTMLHQLLAEGDEVLALTIDYGQRHRREIEAAKATAARLGLEWRLVDLSTLTPLLAGSSLTSPEIAVPHGHYAEESMKLTVVPNRNMLFLAVAAAWAISRKCQRVAYGAHQGDHAIYPDCRPAFVDAMRHALALADWSQIELYCPLLLMDKGQIVARGRELGVDFASTWTCYEGGEKHCGRCGACTERREAFQRAAVADPTTYTA